MLQPKRLASTIIACNTAIAAVLIAPGTASAAPEITTDISQQTMKGSQVKVSEPSGPRTSVSGSVASVELVEYGSSTGSSGSSGGGSGSQKGVKGQQVKVTGPGGPSVSSGESSSRGVRGAETTVLRDAAEVEYEQYQGREPQFVEDWADFSQQGQQGQVYQQETVFGQGQIAVSPQAPIQQTADCGQTQVFFPKQASTQKIVHWGQEEQCPIKGQDPVDPGSKGQDPVDPDDNGGDTPTVPGGSSGSIVPWIVGGLTVAALSSGSSEAPKPQPAPEAPAPVEKPQAKPAPVAQQRVLANTGADASMLMIAALLLTLSGYGVLRLRKQ